MRVMVISWGTSRSAGGNIGCTWQCLGVPATSLRAPTTFLVAPATSLGAPATSLGAPATTLGAPATTLGAQATTLGVPATTLGAPATTLRVLATSFGAPATTLGVLVTSLGALATRLGAPRITREQSGKNNIFLGTVLVHLEIIATTCRSTIFKTDVFSLYPHLCIYIATDLHTVYLGWLQAVLESNSRCA